jgi:mRNA-degrading endonuclease RelE of RelBE toxin-antitoxin system
MNYKVKTIPYFERQLKKLAKKYPSLKVEYTNLIDSLESNPEQGKSLGNNCYKIRQAIASKGKGKSGGARIITHFHITASAVILLDIYDKNEKENITDKELQLLLKSIEEIDFDV